MGAGRASQSCPVTSSVLSHPPSPLQAGDSRAIPEGVSMALGWERKLEGRESGKGREGRGGGEVGKGGKRRGKVSSSGWAGHWWGLNSGAGWGGGGSSQGPEGQ